MSDPKTQSVRKFYTPTESMEYLRQQIARIPTKSHKGGAIGVGVVIAAGELAGTHIAFQGNPMARAVADLFMAGTDFVYPLHSIMAPGYKVSSATPTVILAFWVAAGILTADAAIALLQATLSA